MAPWFLPWKSGWAEYYRDRRSTEFRSVLFRFAVEVGAREHWRARDNYEFSFEDFEFKMPWRHPD